GKVEPNAVLYFDLVDPGQVILDGLFSRNDLSIRAIECIQCGIERGRLSRPRRPGNQDNAVGTPDKLGKLLEVIVRQAELANADLNIVFVQDPHDHRLAVVRRDDADAEVQILVAGSNFDAAVLRAAPLGNVHLSQNLDAGNDGPEQAARWAIALMQNSIDPVANANHLFEGLDVDVRGPELHGLFDHQIDKANDGSTVFVHLFAGTNARRRGRRF